MRFTLLSIITLFYSLEIWASLSINQSLSNQEYIKHGKEIYLQSCVGCHGEKGDGNGPGSAFLNPKPRDFTKGIFKFSSTPLGSQPTDADLVRTLSQGLRGTSMPNFGLLSANSKFSVIEYIKTFSEEWKNPAKFKEPVQGAPFPVEDFKNHKKFVARAQKGRALFVENCITCHGAKGLGDGEGGQELSDDWGNPIKPANLTKPWIKSGATVKDIYRTVMNGLNGTPMVAYKDTISDDGLWDVAAYVLYLRGLRAGLYGTNPPIKEITPEEIK
ncbi:MAG: c-type cytochrome [Bacteriovoracales bacterium]